MADFLKAYKRTCVHEGGYANHPNDKGGETWKGIARNYHPSWLGWKIVDQYKKKHTVNGKLNVKELNKSLFADKELLGLDQAFYRKNFWDVNRLSEINSQLLAENVFDCSVNCGINIGAKLLQRAVNEIVPNALTVDGVIGTKTVSAVNSIDATELVEAYVDLRKNYHRKIVERDPSQRVFLQTWLNRCEAMRKAV